MLLSKRLINQLAIEENLIDPFDDSYLSINSYQLRLGTNFNVPKDDLGNREIATASIGNVFSIEPLTWVLAESLEEIDLTINSLYILEGEIDGYGYPDGLILNCGFGEDETYQKGNFVETNYKGKIKFQIFNCDQYISKEITVGDPIAQIRFHTVDSFDNSSPINLKDTLKKLKVDYLTR